MLRLSFKTFSTLNVPVIAGFNTVVCYFFHFWACLIDHLLVTGHIGSRICAFVLSTGSCCSPLQSVTFCPGWCGLVSGAPAHAPKGLRFNPVPGLPVHPDPVRACATRQPIGVSLFPSTLKDKGKNILGCGFKKRDLMLVTVKLLENRSAL